MNLNNVTLEAVAATPAGYPKQPLPEIVLLGRSNVGKSSLINAILNRKNLAKTSSTPGKTATINFYNIDDKVRIVDLPGYGYAKRGDSQKEKWANMIEEYINKGRYIARFVQLIDIRHLPTENDKIMHEWIKSRGITQTIVFTKADKLSKTAQASNIEAATNELVGATSCRPSSNNHNSTITQNAIAFSAQTKQGRDEFIQLLEEIAK